MPPPTCKSPVSYSIVVIVVVVVVVVVVSAAVTMQILLTRFMNDISLLFRLLFRWLTIITVNGAKHRLNT